MPRAIFEYTKTVLQSVSFDTNLFCKELQKATKYLLPHELQELSLWIKTLVQSNPHLDGYAIYLQQDSALT